MPTQRRWVNGKMVNARPIGEAIEEMRRIEAVNDRERAEQERATRPSATYQEHMTTTQPSASSNYVLSCVCGWEVRLASRSDLTAAETALVHVRTAQPPSIEALFDRL